MENDNLTDVNELTRLLFGVRGEHIDEEAITNLAKMLQRRIAAEQYLNEGSDSRLRILIEYGYSEDEILEEIERMRKE